MKATIEIPDDLYRRVKAKSALEGRRVREVTISLYRTWLGESQPATAPASAAEDTWLDDYLRLAARLAKGAPDGPTASEILDADRSRLESR
ncbi:MAG: hypothetical protein U0821_23130 [Chloroflexota bacterium]